MHVIRDLTALCFPDTTTHSQDQNKEHNNTKDPDENSIPKGYVQRNMTDRSIIFKQRRHILIYVPKYNKPILLSYTRERMN